MIAWPGSPPSLALTRSGTPIASRLFSMKIGESLNRKILHRPRDLSVLDQKRSVARQARVENRALIHRPQIPEPRDEQSALRRTNQVIERSRFRRSSESSRRLPVGARPCFCAQISIVVEILHDAVLDPYDALRRQSVTAERRRRQHRDRTDRRRSSRVRRRPSVRSCSFRPAARRTNGLRRRRAR